MDELEGLVVVSEGEVAEILEVRKTELEAVIKEGEAIHALMVRMEPFLAASRVVIRDEGLEIRVGEMEFRYVYYSNPDILQTIYRKETMSFDRHDDIKKNCHALIMAVRAGVTLARLVRLFNQEVARFRLSHMPNRRAEALKRVELMEAMKRLLK